MPPRARADRSRRTREGLTRRGLAIVVVVILLIVDAVLISLALSGRDPEPSDAAPQVEVVDDVAESPAEPSASPSESPSAEPSDAPQPPATSAPQRVMTAIDGSTAWRVPTGACPEAQVLPEVTRDAGAVWQPFDATAETDLRSVQRLIVSSVDAIAIVGLATDDCSASLVRTYVGGIDWADYPEEVGSAWFIADGGAGVHAPGGIVQPACAAGAVAISVSGTTSAAALCADGSVAATVDGGSTWSAPSALPGVQALAPGTDGYLAAVLGGEGCAGVAIVALDRSGAAPTPVGCRPASGDASSLAGLIALSESSDGTLWLWAGDEVVRSEDRGATWL